MRAPSRRCELLQDFVSNAEASSARWQGKARRLALVIGLWAAFLALVAAACLVR